tara:strand:+ start:154 stop:459 length:306 start_codon:yes stop_codon:yes gene_type:complete
MKRNILKENFDSVTLCEKCLCWKGQYKDLEVEIWYDDYSEQFFQLKCFCDHVSCKTCGEDKRPKPGYSYWPVENNYMQYISGLEWESKCLCCGNDYDFIKI